MMRVGTFTVGTTSRTSMSNAMRMNASAELGVAAFICTLARQARAHSRPSTLGAICQTPFPWPQRSDRVAMLASCSAWVFSPQGHSSSVLSRTSRALEDQCHRALRVRGGEEKGKGPSLGLPDDRGALAADRVHDGPDVVHPLLKRRGAGNSIRHAVATLVEEDEAAELREALAVVSKRRELPVHVQVGVRALRVDEVDRAIADDAIRHVDVAAAGEANLGHATSVTVAPVAVKGGPWMARRPVLLRCKRRMGM